MASRVVERLLQRGLINRAQLELPVEAQPQVGGSIERHLVELGIISEDQLLTATCEAYGIAVAGRSALLRVAPVVIALVPRQLAAAHRIVPIGEAGPELQICVAGPETLERLADVSFALGRRLRPLVTTLSALDEALIRYYGIAPPAQWNGAAAQYTGWNEIGGGLSSTALPSVLADPLPSRPERPAAAAGPRENRALAPGASPFTKPTAPAASPGVPTPTAAPSPFAAPPRLEPYRRSPTLPAIPPQAAPPPPPLPGAYQRRPTLPMAPVPHVVAPIQTPTQAPVVVFDPPARPNATGAVAAVTAPAAGVPQSGEFSLSTGSTQRPSTHVEPPDPFQQLALAAAGGEVSGALFHFFAPLFDDLCLIAIEGAVGVVSIAGNRGLAGVPKQRITVPLAPGTLLGEVISKPQVAQRLEADDAALADVCRAVRLPPKHLTFISLFHEDRPVYLMIGHGRMARDSNETRTLDVFVAAASQGLRIARLRDEMLRMRDRIRRK